MLELIKRQLLKIINDIDSGNSNLDAVQTVELADFLSELNSNNKLYNRTQAAKYLNCSVQSLDLYRKDGTLEEGKKEAGGVIQWTKKQLDDCIERRRRNDNTKKN